jgi:hypothetical protein
MKVSTENSFRSASLIPHVTVTGRTGRLASTAGSLWLQNIFAKWAAGTVGDSFINSIYEKIPNVSPLAVRH